MPEPRLIHPVPVTIEQIDRATTVYDEDAREPLQQAARKTRVTLNGQTSGSLRIAGRGTTRMGRTKDEDGYVLFLTRDLRAKGIDPFTGLDDDDRIVSIGGVATTLYVKRIEPVASYPGLGYTMVKVFVDDRDPVKAV